MDRVDFNTEPVKEIFRKYGVKSIRLFGSVARGEAKADSDVDLIVTFNRRISLLMLIRMERELSETIGRKVDLLTPKSISPYLRKRVLKESRTVYAS